MLKFKQMSVRKMKSEIPFKISQCSERSSLKNEILTGRRITCMEIKQIRRISQYHRNVLNGWITPLPFCSCRRCSIRTAALFPNSFNAILLSGLAANMSLRYVRVLPALGAAASVDCRLACLVKISIVDFCWSRDGQPPASAGSLAARRSANINVFKYHKKIIGLHYHWCWIKLQLFFNRATSELPFLEQIVRNWF